MRENVGRCAVTTLDPETGIRDLDTLGTIAAYRADVPTREPLPFGVWCEVVAPGPLPSATRRGRHAVASLDVNGGVLMR